MIPVPIDVEDVSAAALRPPALVAPAPREVSFGRIAGRVFAGTARIVVRIDGVDRKSVPVAGPGRFSFSMRLPPRNVSLRVVAVDGGGDRAGRTVEPVYGLPPPARPVATRPSVLDRRLARRLRPLARDFGGTAAFYVQDLRTGRGAAWNAGARFPAASTLKLAIAMEVLRTLGRRPAAGSSLDRLLRESLVYSDNAAANSLLVWLGGSTSGGAARVNAMMRSLGLRNSLMYGGYAVGTAAALPIPVNVNEQPSFGVGKYTTAYDLIRLHRSVHQASRGRGPLAGGTGFSRRDARYLLWILARVVDHGKLDRYMPWNASVLHKAGWIRQARHDAGIVYWRGGAFVVAVLTWNANHVGSASDVLAGRIAVRALRRFERLRASGSTTAADSRIA